MTTIAIPEGSLFGPDNLPYGIFSTADTEPRVGVRVGDSVLDLSRVFEDDVVFAEPSLNAFMAQGRAVGTRCVPSSSRRSPATWTTTPSSRSPTSRCTCRSRSPITSTSTHRRTMRRTWAVCSVPRTPTRSCRTGSTCPSVTTAARRPSSPRVSTSSVRAVSARDRMTKRLCTARRSVSTSKRDGLHRRRGLEDG